MCQIEYVVSQLTLTIANFLLQKVEKNDVNEIRRFCADASKIANVFQKMKNQNVNFDETNFQIIQSVSKFDDEIEISNVFDIFSKFFIVEKLYASESDLKNENDEK